MTAESNQKKVFGLPYNVGIGFLCVLGAIVLYEFYSNVLAGPSGVTSYPVKSAASGEAPPTIPMPGSMPGSAAAPRRPSSTRSRGEEFNPPIHPKKPEDRIDPMKVDPSIRWDLLLKVQAVEPAGGTRNLFQMGAPPKAVETATLTGIEPVIRKPIGPAPPPPVVVPPPAALPPVLPIQLKFYGFSMVHSTGKKTAYFMDGEDILIAPEGELVKRRYKVVRINPTSVLMEDTESKRQQSLPLTPEESQG